MTAASLHALTTDAGVGRGPAAASDSPILLVDDNATKRFALRAVLAPLGHRIVEAESGVAALRCVMDEDFAVILLDVCMPDMDGFETAALIRQRRQSEITPIIFITAYHSDEIESRDRYAEGAVDFMFAPVPPDELRSKVTAFVNLFRKATSLADQAKESHASSEQWRLLAAAAPIGIFQTDARNRYAYTNSRWSEITGICAEDAEGQEWDFLVDESERPQLAGSPIGERHDRFVLSAGRPEPRHVLVTSTPIPGGHGRVSGWVGTLADVTTEVAAEVALSDARDKATEASRLKSDFLANMSHEIRTPMNGIIGMTELLLETTLDARQRDYAQTVRNSGEALLTIVNDILDFSKVEAGKLELEVVSFDVRTVLEDVVDLMAGAAQTKGLELIAIVETPVPTAISGDPGRVRQVLTNLIGNAVKFTAVGEVVVRASLASATDVSAVIRFDVSDSGPGIAPDKHQLIFQPFMQEDTSTSRRHGGTGLGLSISGQLVTAMGGSCGVLSQLGAGSTFWFTVECGLDPTMADVHVAGMSPLLQAVPVLVVDDNAFQRAVLCEFLSDTGMSPLGVPTGTDAIAALIAASAAGQPFQVAVVDRSMPGMDGLALCAAMADETVPTPRVVMMRTRQETQAGGGECGVGVTATLSKPIHRDDLALSMRMALLGEVHDVEPPVVSSRERHTGRLLLAEDNLINQKVAIAMLSSVGYVVDIVPDGAAAVRAAAANRYDAILMDCQMPEMNGYEATAVIRASEDATGRHTPIIAMTAGARREDRDQCLAAGMDSYVSKPISKDTLLALVAQFTRRATPTLPRPGDDVVLPISGCESITARLDELFEGLGDNTGADRIDLLESFLRRVAMEMDQIDAAAAVDDSDALGARAHSVKGMAGNIGASRVADAAADIEDAARDGHLEQLPHAATILRRAVADADELIRGMLAVATSSR